MKAIYQNRLYNIIESSTDLTLETSSGLRFDVEFGDDELVVDPTDSEVAATDNLAEYYGIDGEAASQLERMLRADISIGQWESWKTSRTKT